MKTPKECIDFCKDKLSNPQNVKDEDFYLSIMKYIKDSDRLKKIEQIYFNEKLVNEEDIREKFYKKFFLDVFDSTNYDELIPQKEIDAFLKAISEEIKSSNEKIILEDNKSSNKQEIHFSDGSVEIVEPKPMTEKEFKDSLKGVSDELLKAISKGD